MAEAGVVILTMRRHVASPAPHVTQSELAVVSETTTRRTPWTGQRHPWPCRRGDAAGWRPSDLNSGSTVMLSRRTERPEPIGPPWASHRRPGLGRRWSP